VRTQPVFWITCHQSFLDYMPSITREREQERDRGRERDGERKRARAREKERGGERGRTRKWQALPACVYRLQSTGITYPQSIGISSCTSTLLAHAAKPQIRQAGHEHLVLLLVWRSLKSHYISPEFLSRLISPEFLSRPA
jgi:hypothetical protein